MSKLHEAVSIEAQPGNIAIFRGLHEGCSARSERARLRVANEAIALVFEIPVRFRRIVRLDVVGQQAEQQLHRERTRFATDGHVLVLEYHVVLTDLTGAPGAAE